MDFSIENTRGMPLIRRPLRSLLLKEASITLTEVDSISPPVSAPSTPVPTREKYVPTKDSLFVITPISATKTNKANIDYSEQMDRIDEGKPLVWDDTKFNKSRPGDMFGFWMYKNKVKVHTIQNVSSPEDRLPSWHKNVGQSDRNVVTLSKKFFVIDWEEWIEIGGAKRCMGTANANKSLKNVYELSKGKF
tara:strand:+ start:80 stop:652 length:573 start_codon:yes stop_codon:yes gene_type:complete